MKVAVSEIELVQVDADLLAIGLYEGDELPAELSSAAGVADAKGSFKKRLLLHPGKPERVLIVGLGEREELDAERARVAAALAAQEARKLGATSLAWALPESGEDAALTEGIVTGTILGSYRFDRFHSVDPDDPPPPALDSLTLLAPESVAAAAETA